MLGAICGDIIGSIYEWNNIKTKDFELLTDINRFTDDTVMTTAIAKAAIEYKNNKNLNIFRENCIKHMKELGRKYINVGYGSRFKKWLENDNQEPYNSYGNGSAMRVSPVAYIAESLEEVEELAKISAEVTHNHPEGIKGAVSVATSIWLLRNGYTKEDVKKHIENKYYKLDFTIDKIRKDYKFDVTCQGSVPQAIEAFLESKDFEDSIRNAISIGGDSDTIAAITGSLAEAYYEIPNDIKDKITTYLDETILNILEEFYI